MSWNEQSAMIVHVCRNFNSNSGNSALTPTIGPRKLHGFYLGSFFFSRCSHYVNYHILWMILKLYFIVIRTKFSVSFSLARLQSAFLFVVYSCASVVIDANAIWIRAQTDKKIRPRMKLEIIFIFVLVKTCGLGALEIHIFHAHRGYSSSIITIVVVVKISLYINFACSSAWTRDPKKKRNLKTEQTNIVNPIIKSSLALYCLCRSKCRYYHSTLPITCNLTDYIRWLDNKMSAE